MNQAELVAAAVESRRRPKPNKSAEMAFAFQCLAMSLPPVIALGKLERPGVLTENTRKQAYWVFDFLFRDFKIIVEIDGGIWMRGGGAHSHPVDITRNMAKGNDAVLQGYSVLRFTPDEVKSGHAIAFTQRLLAAKGWRAS